MVLIVIKQKEEYTQYRGAEKKMVKRDIIEKLKKHENELRQKGVTHAAIFGSYAREEQKIGSDIDILIELSPSYEMDIFSYVGLKNYIAHFFDCPVDVIHKAALKKELRGIVEKEAVYVF